MFEQKDHPQKKTLPTGSENRLIWRTIDAFKPYRPSIGIVTFLILITAGLGVVNPLLIKVIFDSVLFPRNGVPDLNLLWWLAGIMVGITLVTGLFGIIQTYLTNSIGQNVMRDLRNRLYGHLQSLSLGFFTDTRTGEVQSRISDDVGGIQNVVTTTLSQVLSNFVIVVSTIVAMSILSWQLTLVAVGTVPVFLLLTKTVGDRRRSVTEKSQKAAAEVTAITQETLSISGVILAKLFGRQGHEIQRFKNENQRLSDLEIQLQMTGQAFFAAMQIFFSIAPVIVYVIAGYMLSGNGPTAVSAGTLVAFTTLQARLFFPVGSLMQISVEMQSSLALFERIFGYLDIKAEITDHLESKDLNPTNVKGRVEFESVRLSYHSSSGIEMPRSNLIWALDGMSFQIEPGQLAAFVGPSGSGKTSVSYLIPRLYDPTDGSVKIDGIDVKHIRLDSLTKIVGYVTQESYLFHASLRKNMLYGDLEATQENLENAAKAAFIHDRIMEFPDGYDTVVGERGYRLSGGERQRLSIARVILHNPRVLILDEATSALDTSSERKIQTALEPLMRDRTTIAIAHRLSTIQAADVIYVIDRGQIVQKGNHKELLKDKGLYAHLYEEQFGGGRIESRCKDGVILSDGKVLSLGESDPDP